MITYFLTNPLQHDLKPLGPLKGHHEIHDLQKALHTANIYHGVIDGIFGVGTAQACKQAKFQLGYPLTAVNPTGGQVLYNYLTGVTPLPAAYKLRRRLRGYGLTKDEVTRSKVVSWAHWGALHEPQIHYSMGSNRDDWLYHTAGALPMTTDCSGFVTACYRWGGADDPSGLAYKYVGFTGTLLDHGTTVPLSQAEPGDLVIWGIYPGHHVAIFVDVTNRADPLIVSHGQESGPSKIRLSVEDAAQNRSRVVKRYIGA